MQKNKAEVGLGASFFGRDCHARSNGRSTGALFPKKAEVPHVAIPPLFRFGLSGYGFRFWRRWFAQEFKELENTFNRNPDRRNEYTNIDNR